LVGNGRSLDHVYSFVKRKKKTGTIARPAGTVVKKQFADTCGKKDYNTPSRLRTAEGVGKGDRRRPAPAING
jgi:hypothetical protein